MTVVEGIFINLFIPGFIKDNTSNNSVVSNQEHYPEETHKASKPMLSAPGFYEKRKIQYGALKPRRINEKLWGK